MQTNLKINVNFVDSFFNLVSLGGPGNGGDTRVFVPSVHECP